MLRAIESNWRVLKSGRPGNRFQNLHRHRRKEARGEGPIARVLTIGLGILLVLAGPVAGMVPGPGGIVVFLLGAALLASELLLVARALDWCEPRARKLWKAGRGAWSRTTMAARIALCVTGAALVATVVVFYVHGSSGA